MRKFPGLAVVAALSLAAVAWASPPGVKESHGTFISPDNKPLYTFTNDRTAGKSSCNGECASAWPPLAAAANAQPSGDWTVITRDDGSKQWAYKGKPLYTYRGDTAGQTPADRGPAWPIVVK